MSSSAPSASGFMVVTHVLPPQGGQNSTSPESRVVSTPPSLLGEFRKGEPVALGTVQIMIGVVVLLFGVVTAFDPMPSTYTGVMVWGAIIYITAGSLTVRANQRLNHCLVKASLGMSIFSTVSAGIAIIMHCLDLEEAHYVWANTGEVAGVMLVLSILEFIVSIYVSAFACKATCSSETEQIIYVSNQVPSSFSTTHLSAPPLNPPQVPLFQSSVMPPAPYSSADGLKAGNPDDVPPEYTATQE